MSLNSHAMGSGRQNVAVILAAHGDGNVHFLAIEAPIHIVVVCAVERPWDLAGESLVRQLVAPAGSSRSSSGGNETAGAFGNGRFWRSASQQAVTRVNVGPTCGRCPASKSMLQEPTLHNEGEGCHREAEWLLETVALSDRVLHDPAGVLTTAC